MIDLPFEDCSPPPPEVVSRFLAFAERIPGALAVHGRGGLGRTGTLVALYMIKHHGFSAREAMGWLRIVRPGSVIGPQQQYLCEMEAVMRSAGDWSRYRRNILGPLPVSGGVIVGGSVGALGGSYLGGSQPTVTALTILGQHEAQAGQVSPSRLPVPDLSQLCPSNNQTIEGVSFVADSLSGSLPSGKAGSRLSAALKSSRSVTYPPRSATLHAITAGAESTEIGGGTAPRVRLVLRGATRFSGGPAQVVRALAGTSGNARRMPPGPRSKSDISDSVAPPKLATGPGWPRVVAAKAQHLL